MKTRLLLLLVGLTLATCTNQVEDIPQEGGTGSIVAGAPAPDADVQSDEDIREEAALLAEAPEVMRRIKAGLPLEGEEGFQEESAYQRRKLGGNSSGVLLGRMTVSEGTSIMPLRPSWQRDMQGILQVARENQKPEEILYESLARHSPHVSLLKEYTRPRQRWTSTLPAKGEEPPELWIECTEWYFDKRRDRKRGLPKGCNGVWENGVKNWETIRAYAKKLVRMKSPPTPVQGEPTAWGGHMDIARYLERNPGKCWLESGDTRNYFFGDEDNPANECKEVSEQLIKESRVISAQIIRRDMRRNREQRPRAGSL